MIGVILGLAFASGDRLYRSHNYSEARDFSTLTSAESLRECLDHIIIFGETHTYRALKSYMLYYK